MGDPIHVHVPLSLLLPSSLPPSSHSLPPSLIDAEPGPPWQWRWPPKPPDTRDNPEDSRRYGRPQERVYSVVFEGGALLKTKGFRATETSCITRGSHGN